MNKIDRAIYDIGYLDDLAQMDSPIQKLNSLAKFIVTISFIIITVSFNKYDLTGIISMFIYIYIIYMIAGIDISLSIKKLWMALPLIIGVGIVNPFIDKEVITTLFNIPITGGIISMTTLILKGIFTLNASFILIATTSIDRICLSLRKIKVPSIMVSLILLTYRYIHVMMKEVSIMTMAYHLRAPNQKGINISSWGSFLGQLFLRSIDTATELYESMKLRGYNGEFNYVTDEKMTIKDIVYMIASILVFIIFRVYNIAYLIGSIFI